MAYVVFSISEFSDADSYLNREVNLHAMRMGPGKHLKGLKLMDGLVQPEEFDYFHEVHRMSLCLALI